VNIDFAKIDIEDKNKIIFTENRFLDRIVYIVIAV